MIMVIVNKFTFGIMETDHLNWIMKVLDNFHVCLDTAGE